MLVRFHRQRFTFGLQINRRMYPLQFTTEDPWWFPKCDKHCGKNKDIVLYGWLFVYFGYTDL